MLEGLSSKFESFFKTIKGRGKFSEKNIEEISQKLRFTLLEADVNYQVAKGFVAKVSETALGQKVHESLTPAQHYIKIVKEQLTELLGSQTSEIDLRAKPPLVIMMVGLQGSGKTTTSGKIAKYLRDSKDRNPFLASCDIYRPAAIEQLAVVAESLKIAAFFQMESAKAVEMCKAAVMQATTQGHDTVIIDTAGRMHVDEEMLSELVDIKKAINPHEILLVADSMTGQQAVNIAKNFHEKLSLTGIVLSKMDGDARGGAALSMKYITGVPIKFIGVGEKYEALELFHPDRMASRILQMGDMLSLIEKTQGMFDEKEAEKLQKKIKTGGFGLEDFKKQMKQMQKMGGFGGVLKMIPGASKLAKNIPKGVDFDQEFKKMTAIIDSMTLKERRYSEILNGSRRLRIAQGSGTQVSDVNKLMKQFTQTKKMMKKMSKFGNKMPMDLLGGLK